MSHEAFGDEGNVATHCRRCSECEGQDHHWMEACDDDSGEPIWVCKHCDATKEYE